MLRILASVFASATMIATGVLHGQWTDRWQKPPQLAEAAARLEQVPTVLGEWEIQDTGNKPPPADPTLAGALYRTYVHRRTGQHFTIFLVCGRPGPVGIHPPDACYGASGFQMGERTRIPAPGATGEFWTASAVRANSTEETKLRIYWAWNAGQGWAPSDDARLQFARAPVLHKLYVVRDLNTLEENAQGRPVPGVHEAASARAGPGVVQSQFTTSVGRVFRSPQRKQRPCFSCGLRITNCLLTQITPSHGGEPW